MSAFKGLVLVDVSTMVLVGARARAVRRCKAAKIIGPQVPGVFPDGMAYHFDGLATVMKFTFSDDGATASVLTKPYASDAFLDYDRCVFYGTGTGPTRGREICFLNPGVNLLPIDGQLWLTIDTSSWGRVDPDTLETVDAKAKVDTLVLNAHPACDRSTNECFVRRPSLIGFRGDESRRRRRRNVDSPWRRVAATPPLQRG